MADFGAIKPRFKNAYEDKGVVLTPISDAIQDDQNLEPQMVRVRSQNNGLIFLDMENRGPADSPQRFILDTQARKIKRWSLNALNLCWVTPNVNQRNGIITFFSTSSAAEHSVRVLEGFYLSPALLMAALVTALNTVTGASGLTWTWTVDPNSPITGLLTTAGGNYHFVNDNTPPQTVPAVLSQEPIQPTSYYMRRGRYLWNLPLTTVDTNSKRVGPICIQYTRYVDIESFSLSQYTKNPNTATGDGATSIIVRLYIGEPIPDNVLVLIRNLRWCNYDNSQALTGLDFRVLDEWNELLYVPPYASEDGVTPFYLDWIMELLTEV